MLRPLCVTAIVVSLSLAIAASRSAEARRIKMPTVSRSCSGSATWKATQSCLEQFGTATILRAKGDFRLVQLRGRDGDVRSSGLYLYVQAMKRWHLGGMYIDREPTVVGFSTPTYDRHKIVRIDVAYAAHEDLVLDEFTSRNAFVRRKTAVFCAGSSPDCTQIVTACDVFVGGRLHSTFRGTLAYEGAGMMRVTGERSRAGDQCAQPEQAVIPVPSLDPVFEP